MAENQLTGLQKRAEKFIDRTITYTNPPAGTVTGHFIGFDDASVDRAVIQLSNAADRITVPLMYVVNFFEENEEARQEAIRNLTYEKRPAFKAGEK